MQPLLSRSADFQWWKHGVIYQVYLRSFQDSNGDGVGDLAGLIARLDYLTGLGVDAIWLSPIFSSPMAVFGYYVSDHIAVDPLFGDLAVFRELVSQVHSRGLKIILDYIPNHTSEQHAWFLESRASRTAAKRDWYVWRDPGPGGGPPNNWRGEFGGSAWSWDEPTGQYYYHAFLPSQPDLNWRNPATARAMLNVLRFWLDEGVDGFRVDAIHHLLEDESLADNPPNPQWREAMGPAEQFLKVHTVDQPEVHTFIAAMRRLVEGYGADRVLIGEAYLPIPRLMAYYGGALDGFHLPFNFHLMTTPWTPLALASLIGAYEAALPAGGWPNWVLSNHDRSRLASRLGEDQARVAAMLLLTLRGTPTLYQGDELGLTDVSIPPDRVRDPWELNVPGLGLGRDPARTPMLWSGAPQRRVQRPSAVASLERGLARPQRCAPTGTARVDPAALSSPACAAQARGSLAGRRLCPARRGRRASRLPAILPGELPRGRFGSRGIGRGVSPRWRTNPAVDLAWAGWRAPGVRSSSEPA